MSARDQLAELIAKTNQQMGRPAGAFNKVTPEEMLRLWRNNPAFRDLVGPAANVLLARYDAEEREAELKRQADFTIKNPWGNIDINDLLDELIKDAEHHRRWRDQYEQRWDHQTDAFAYATFGGSERRFYDFRSGNPFGRSPTQPPPSQPVDPERAAAIAQARKIKALADDERGNQHQRDVARRKLADLTAKHGLTEQGLR